MVICYIYDILTPKLLKTHITGQHPANRGDLMTSENFEDGALKEFSSEVIPLSTQLKQCFQCYDNQTI